MFSGITAVFGIDFDHAQLSSIIASAIGTTAGTPAVRAVVGSVLKMTGLGTIPGMLVAGSTAAALTTAIGKAYVATLTELLMEDPTRSITSTIVATRLRRKLKV